MVQSTQQQLSAALPRALYAVGACVVSLAWRSVKRAAESKLVAAFDACFVPIAALLLWFVSRQVQHAGVSYFDITSGKKRQLDRAQ